MAFNKGSDLFISVRDVGLNKLFRIIAQQRPALLNRASDTKKLCAPVDAHSAVAAHGKPTVTTMKPVPVGRESALPACVQVRHVLVDLPPHGVHDPVWGVSPEKAAVHVDALVGVQCPGASEIACAGVNESVAFDLTFELGTAAQWFLKIAVDECSGVLAVPQDVLPLINCLIGAVPLSAHVESSLLGIVDYQINPTPPGGGIVSNPLTASDQLICYLDFAVAPRDDGTLDLAPSYKAGALPVRTNTGAFDLTVAATEDTLTRLVRALVTGLQFSAQLPTPQPATLGGISIGYDLEVVGVELGSLELRADNTVRIAELDIKWSTLVVTLGLNLPQVCLPNSSVCVFGGNPDLTVVLDLGPHIRSELSLTASPVMRHARHPDRGSLDDWSAFDAGKNVQPPTYGPSGLLDRWQLFLDPLVVDVDLIDVADTVGDLFDAALKNAFSAVLAPLDPVSRKAMELLIGSVVEFVRKALDIPDDFSEWLADQLKENVGLGNLLVAKILQYFQVLNVYEISDPVGIEASDPEQELGLMLPLGYVEVHVDADELVLQADVGDLP